MALVYDKLWFRLAERGMKKKDLRELAGISRASIAKLGKNENVTTDVLAKVCIALQCDISDIAEAVLETEEAGLGIEKDEIPDTQYRLNSFFAGIGGFDIGFERNGFATQFLCEINPFCNEVLKRHWPQVERVGDISELHPDDVPDAEVWCGGFPCQDISVARGAAGRLGLGGSRSGLFFEYARLIEVKQPTAVVIENVEGLFNSNGGRDFGMILQRLQSMGYAVAWRLFNSRYFGVPQSRPRVYLCCWKESAEKALKVMFDHEGAHKTENERKDFLTEASRPGEYPKVPKVAYCLAATSGRHTGTDWSRTYVVCSNGVRRMTPLEYERLQGFPDYWTLPESGDVNSDDMETLRYTAVGNAVSVPVVEWVAKRVHEQLANNEGRKLSRDEIQSYVPEFAKVSWSGLDLDAADFSDTSVSYKWPKAGIAYDNSFIGGNVPPTPAVPKQSSLMEIVERQDAGTRYYLTPNAAEGILRRVDNNGRKLFVPLREALEKEKAKKKQ